MNTTKRRQTLALPILALAMTASLFAQGNPASLLIDLDGKIPINVAAQGGRVPLRHQVDWEHVADLMGELLSRAEGSEAEPATLFYMGNALFNAGRIEEAQLSFKDLQAKYPKHPLVRVPIQDDTKSLVGQALEDCAKEMAFRSNHEVKSMPDPELDSSVMATLHFSTGDVDIRLFKNVAREHRENFLKLAAESFYDRTCVHRINPDVDVHMGCPKSRERNMQLWGQGNPGYDLPQEFSRLFHKRGILSSISAPRSGRSHGSQFVILLKDQPTLDFVQTPFAKVADEKSLSVVHAISVSQRNQNGGPLRKVFLNGISIKQAGKEEDKKD